MNKQLIIFDCDGVLVDSEVIGNRVFAEAVVSLGIPMTTEEAIERFAGIEMAKSLAYVENLLGRSLPEDFVTNFRQASFAAFRRELQPVPGIRTVLKKLPKPFCVASNGPRNKIELNLELTNLLPFFADKIFSAYELGVWKPDPAFYLKVVEKMGFHAKDCIVIEDSRFGVQAARSAGMLVYGYTAGDPAKERELSAAGAVPFERMADLPQLLFFK